MDDHLLILDNNEDLEPAVVETLLLEVEENLGLGRDVVADAVRLWDESRDFDVMAERRTKSGTTALSETTKRKMVRKHEELSGEVKDKLEKAASNLRKISHHYAHVKATVERALRFHEKQGRMGQQIKMEYDSVRSKVSEAERTIEALRDAKEQAMVSSQTWEVQLRETQQNLSKSEDQRRKLEKQLKTTEQTLTQTRQHAQCLDEELLKSKQRVEQLEADKCGVIGQEESTRDAYTKAKQQLEKAKTVLARVTADNMVFVGRIKFLEAKLAVAVREKDEAKSELDRSDEQWFAHLRGEFEKIAAKHIKETEQQEQRWEVEKFALTEKIKNLERTKEDNTNELHKLKEELNLMHERYDGTFDRLQKTEEQLRESLKKGEEDKYEVGNVNAQLTTALGRAKELEEKYESLKMQHHDLNLQLEQAHEQYQHQLEHAGHMEDEIHRLSFELQRAGKLNDIMMAEKAAVDRKMYEVLSNQQLLERELEHLQRDSSRPHAILPLSSSSRANVAAASSTSSSTSSSLAPSLSQQKQQQQHHPPIVPKVDISQIRNRNSSMSSSEATTRTSASDDPNGWVTPGAGHAAKDKK